MTFGTVVKTSLLATALLMSVGCAGHYKHGGYANKAFEKYDEDDNGMVTQDEFANIVKERFNRCDDNNDGKVTFSEYKESKFSKFMPDMANRIFDRYDLDRNQVVDAEEISKMTKREFKEMDSDRNSHVTQDEMKRYRKGEIFKIIDTNHDGLITKQEFQDARSPFDIRGR
jgi:Ca2+-binding EF-hand superfamily protein